MQNGDAGIVLAAAAVTIGAFYACFSAVRSATERALAERVDPPSWTRYALPVSILAFLAISLAVAVLAPPAFLGMILGGCIGVTVAFQVRRPRRPLPPPEPSASGPSDPSEPPAGSSS
jgi:uncharacterized membrane protein YfcA